MEIFVEKCCGLDVHQSRIVACVLTGKAGSKPTAEIRTFLPFTRDLLALADWVKASGCTHVAMESTGIYWKPLYAILEAEGCFELVVGNAQHMKNVPGRKTDVKDAEWIGQLLRLGLIKPSFVPTQELRDLRDLTRYRKALVQDRTTQTNRIIKLLEEANVKLKSVASNVFGVSGSAILEALVEGKSTPEQMAELAKGRLRKKLSELQRALEGRISEHQRALLRLQLRRLKAHDADISRMDKRIERAMKPHHEQVELLTEVPGIDKVSAAAVIAEVGTKMEAFHSQKAFSAWAGLCPGNNETGGKNRRAPVRKGNRHLRIVLIQCAWGAVRTKNSYWRDKFYRLKARRGGNRAIVAIAHKLAKVIYALLKTGVVYAELGASFLDERDRTRTANNLLRRLERLGYDVALQPKAA
jgi:transposase